MRPLDSTLERQRWDVRLLRTKPDDGQGDGRHARDGFVRLAEGTGIFFGQNMIPAVWRARTVEFRKEHLVAAWTRSRLGAQNIRVQQRKRNINLH